MVQLHELFRRGSPIAVLAGAGISLNSPSNLLAGGPFVDETLKRAVPADVNLDLVLSVRQKPQSQWTRPGEFLRFEVLMAGLRDSEFDADLNVLNCLAVCQHPNANHFALAAMIHAGCVVMTTNFDTLIEQAFQALAFKGPPLRVVCEDHEFPLAPKPRDSPPTLWKLHGTLELEHPTSRRSLQATMTSVLALPMTGCKSAFLRSVLEGFDLLTLGYSGSDDLDLMPVITETPSPKRLLWVSHVSGASTPTIRDGEALVRDCMVTWPEDLVGWRRILFGSDDEGQAPRQFEDVLEITASTDDVIDCLRRVYGLRAPTTIPVGEHRFGRGHPTIVTDYFDDWYRSLRSPRTAVYELALDLLTSRSARSEVTSELAFIQSRLKQLRREPDAGARDRLNGMMDMYSESRDKPSSLLLEIQGMFDELPSDLGPFEEAMRSRLEACLKWRLDGAVAGEKAFRRAVRLSRDRGDAVSEFTTLMTWRNHAKYSQWTDLYPEYVHVRVREKFDDAQIERERLANRQLTGEAFPDEENRRLLQLADETGHLPMLWQLQFKAVIHILDDQPMMRLVNFYRLKRVLRFSVDTGDVRGELIAESLLARLYLIDATDNRAMCESAIQHLLRTLELGRLVTERDIQHQAEWHLNGCQLNVRKGYVEEMRRLVQQSMWGREVN